MITAKFENHAIRVLLSTSVVFLCLSRSPNASADGGGTFSLYVADRNGYVDRGEFEALSDSRRNRQGAPDLWVFGIVDSDRDGKIAEKEMIDTLLEEMKRKQQSR